MTVLVACGHSDGSERMATSLREAGHCAVIIDTSEQLLDATATLEPDLVLIGCELDDKPERLIEALVERTPAAKVVVMARDQTELDLLAAIQAGAVGYLPSAMAGDRLVATLESVNLGEPAIPRHLVATLIQQFRSPGRVTIDLGEGEDLDVTDREWEVLCLLRQGYETKEIASRLFISKATVRSHIAALLKKVGADDRAALIQLSSDPAPDPGLDARGTS